MRTPIEALTQTIREAERYRDRETSLLNGLCLGEARAALATLRRLQIYMSLPAEDRELINLDTFFNVESE